MRRWLIALFVVLAAYSARAEVSSLAPFDTSAYAKKTDVQQPPTVTMAASFGFDLTMYKVRANAASGAITGTLPACTAAIKGRAYILKKIDSSANAAIYATSGSDTIDGATGATAVSITTQYASVKVTCSDVAGAWDRGD